MPRLLTVLFLAALLTGPVVGQVPDQFRGTWSLDEETSMKAIDAAGSDLTTPERDRLIQGVTGELKDLVVEITDSTMTYAIPGSSQQLSLVLEEQTADRAVLSSHEAGTITLQIGEDGRLNTRSSKDDDFDHFYFQRRDPAAADSDVPSNDSVAYLDALKACSPGDYHLSYPGFGTFENTVIGKYGDRCRVRIEHSQLRLTCDYSEATITLLTTNEKYEEARNGVLSGSTDSEESKRAATECSAD